MNVLIVIPAFNEAESLGDVIDEVRSFQPQRDILVVDDGSADQTSAIAVGRKVPVLRHPFNLGAGAAVQTGLIFAARWRR